MTHTSQVRSVTFLTLVTSYGWLFGHLTSTFCDLSDTQSNLGDWSISFVRFGLTARYVESCVTTCMSVPLKPSVVRINSYLGSRQSAVPTKLVF